jgi:probable rRNA maturation factor
MQGTCDMTTTLRGPLPRIPFSEMKEAILGKGYSLSLVICGDTLAQRLNAEHRKKTYAPNVLSFPLNQSEGEIFLNIRKAEREAKAAGITLQKRTALLFVHGCFHLKGREHSDAMEAAEQKVLKRFNLA